MLLPNINGQFKNFEKVRQLEQVFEIKKLSIVCKGVPDPESESIERTEDIALKYWMKDFTSLKSLRKLRLLDLYANFNINTQIPP
jgi:hypothetical protein